jgi:hypothetical protein
MIRFDRFFRNPFDDDGISLDELSAYTTDNLGRMIANNPGAFLNARITATTVAFTALETCVDDDQAKLGLRKARVMLKDQYRTTLPGHLEYIEAAIRATYKGAADAPVLECFPQGRTIFAKCTDDHLNNHLSTLVTQLTALTVPNGPMPNSALGDAGGLQSTWLALYGASESSSANKTATEEGKRTTRTALQLELFRNLLFLALTFPKEPEKAALYMRQSLLEDHPSEEEEPENPTP